MTYTVFYRKPGWRFWKKLENVANDFLLYDEHMNVIPGWRAITLSDGSRVELPTTNLIVKFSPERNVIIEQNKQKEIAAGGKS